MDKPRNFIISDVILNWARLDTPVSPFGTPQWELQLELTAEQAAALSKEYFNVKEKDGKFTVSLKRKAVKMDGSPMDPVRVVDAKKMPIARRNSIGNGSRGNVIVWQAPYDRMGNQGISSSLTAVQVVDLVEYVSETDFDIVGETSGSVEADLF